MFQEGLLGLLLYEFSRGNQVDGSPRVAIAKRARRGGCTQVRRTMKTSFLKVIASWKCLLIIEIVVKNILKFIEMVLKFENDFRISEFYRIHFF